MTVAMKNSIECIRSKLTARWREGGPFGGPFVALFQNQATKRKCRPSRTNNWQLTHAGLTHTYGSSANTIPAHIFLERKFLSVYQSTRLAFLRITKDFSQFNKDLLLKEWYIWYLKFFWPEKFQEYKLYLFLALSFNIEKFY